jgi:hypothetical protein
VRVWEPSAWMAITGVAGSGDGCNRPFWQRDDAVAYVEKHGGVGVMGGFVRPLYELPSFMATNPEERMGVIRPPLALAEDQTEGP